MGKNPPANPEPNSLLKSSLKALKPALRMLARPQTLAQLPRLFSEGMGPVRRLFIQATNQKELSRLVRGGDRVNFISSFARSGNTWTRNLLADALLQGQGIETDTDLPIPFQEVVPDYYCDLITKRNAAIKMSGILVKTHDSFELLRDRILGRSEDETRGSQGAGHAFRSCKIVYLYRSPEDVLVSYFHLQRKVNYIEKSQFGIDEFCRSQLAHWIENLDSYLKAADDGVQVYFVSYESMLQDPGGSLAGILRFLDVPHDTNTVQRAVAHMEFAKLRAREDRDRPGTSEYSLRRGGAGAALEELQPQVRCEIREATAHLLKRAGKKLARQASLYPAAAPLKSPAASTSTSPKAESLQPI